MALASDHESQLVRRYRDRWEKEKGERAAAVQDVIRLVPQNRSIGESLLRQLPSQFMPEKEDEFIAADQMYAILGQLAKPVHATATIDRARNLVSWADRTQDPDFKGKRFDNAIRLFTEAIEMPEATVAQKAWAYIWRGVTFNKKEELEKAIADYTAVIDMPEATVEQKVSAYFTRCLLFKQKKDMEKAIADCTAVIEMPEANVEQKVEAYFNRSLVFWENRDRERAIADCNAIIEMPEAKIEAKERVYRTLGFWLYLEGKYEKSIDASSKALDINPRSTLARANLGLALLHFGNTKRALEEYTEVLAKIQDPKQLDREVIADLTEALNAGRKLSGMDEVLSLAYRRRKELEQEATRSA